METNSPALSYANAIRAWMDAHPSEVIIIWFSRHGASHASVTATAAATDSVKVVLTPRVCAGDPCNTVYPNVPQPLREAFWKQIETVFSGMLLDTRKAQVNTTAVSDLVATGQRVVAYVSPHNFTGGSPYSLDGCTIDNDGTGDDLYNYTHSFHNYVQMFSVANSRREADKANNRLYLLSFAANVPASQIETAALLTYLPEFSSGTRDKCLASLGIPGNTFCPVHLMDASLLGNYYQQPVFELGLTAGYDFPGAIYIDAVDVNGTIRIGPQLFGPAYSGGNGDEDATSGDPALATARYAYVDTLLLASVRRLCASQQNATLCAEFTSELQHQRSLYPMQQWTDVATGRVQDWPQ